MELRVAILMLFLAIAGGAEAGTRKRPSLCISCHGVHYADRGNCTSCHRGNDRSDRKNIAHRDMIPGSMAHFTLGDAPQVREGKQLIDRFACRRCHWISGKGSRRASNLDRLYATTPPQAIQQAITKPAVFMPDFHVTEQQGIALVNAIMAGGRAAGEERRELPQVVHFVESGEKREDSFTANCGPCHRLLSEQYGGLGTGDAGPNLSGIFSEFYPHTFEGKRAWTEERLKTWLKNPRKVRPGTTMRPVLLEEEKLPELLRILER